MPAVWGVLLQPDFNPKDILDNVLLTVGRYHDRTAQCDVFSSLYHLILDI